MTRLALALAFLTAALGIAFGTFTAGGADSYGYVSQADLWLQRTLIIDEPLADEAPWRNANWTLTPFGYRPGDRRGTMVPTYSPGLPMVMAAFKAVGGPNAVYYVVPLLGALTVWLTFVLGSRMVAFVRCSRRSLRLDVPSLSASRVPVDAGTCRERIRVGSSRPTVAANGGGHRIGRRARALGRMGRASGFPRASRRSQICCCRPDRRRATRQCRDPFEPAQRQPPYYAGRITMRFEWLDPDMYVPALEHFERLSRPVYVVLDDWEREIFRSRYAAVSDLSWLDRPPLLLAGQRVYFYAIPATGHGVRP